jgi:hypothetical protein
MDSRFLHRQNCTSVNSHNNGDGSHVAGEWAKADRCYAALSPTLWFTPTSHCHSTTGYCRFFYFSLWHKNYRDTYLMVKREEHAIPLLRKDIASSHMDESSKYKVHVEWRVSIWRN